MKKEEERNGGNETRKKGEGVKVGRKRDESARNLPIVSRPLQEIQEKEKEKERAKYRFD